MRLGHVHLKVRRLERAIGFYRDVLALAVVERLPGQYAFLSFGVAHHDLALQAVGEDAPGPSPQGVGLYHSAFEVPSERELLAAWDRLDRLGVAHADVDHGISWAVYFNDPDGNGVEVYLDRRHAKGGREVWNGVSGRLTRERVAREAEAAPSSGMHTEAR